MKLGIYMGSFNPVHIGHIKVINYLLENKYVDRIIVVPTLNYWSKNDLIDIHDRIKMLEFLANDFIKIDKKNNHLIYTYDLVKALEKEYPNDELYLIMGADNIIDFHRWKNYQELLKYKIIVMNRGNIDIQKYLENLGENHFIVLSDYPFIDISSSELRENLNHEYLDDRVFEYIKKKSLYHK